MVKLVVTQMHKILISHSIDPYTIHDLGLRQIDYPANEKFTGVNEQTFYASNSFEELLYMPSIAAKQRPQEECDPTLEVLRRVLITFQPDVLIVGNNAVPGRAIRAWRQAVGPSRDLLIIRRGVDKRAIDCKVAAEESVRVGNLPGINSPFVAKFQVEWLKLSEDRANSKIAIIGVGNIGKNIALRALDFGLDVHLFSPSLQDIEKRDRTLRERSIPPDLVTCATSLEAAFENAKYIAISVPWLDSYGNPHRGLLTRDYVENVQNNAKISSVSPPRMFSDQALAWMNRQVKQGHLAVRIDSAKRLVKEISSDYSHLELGHDVAFADSACQQALDRAMLNQARDFAAVPV